MADDSIHQAHDKLFKSGFSKPETAAAFLREQFSPELANRIDWASLRLEGSEFVDSQYRKSETDLLYSAQIDGKAGYLYILFEHQSSPDHWIALRLLRYMVRIWEHVLKYDSKPTRLPAILPVVLAQNAEHWETPTQLRDLINMPDGAEAFVPDFAFRFIQLADIPFERIPGTASGVLILRTLKANALGDLFADPVWDELLARNALPTFEMILAYILNARDVDKTKFLKKINIINDTEVRDMGLTLAEQFRLEGKEAGILEGERKGEAFGRLASTRDGILRILTIRFGEVNPELVERLEAESDADRLNAALELAVRCESAEAFSATY